MSCNFAHELRSELLSHGETCGRIYTYGDASEFPIFSAKPTLWLWTSGLSVRLRTDLVSPPFERVITLADPTSIGDIVELVRTFRFTGVAPFADG